MSASPPTDDARWNDFRAAMPIARSLAYFDHAAVAPLSGPAREALVGWANEAAELGASVWLRWSARLEQVRQAAARLIGAGDDEIALVRNTTDGISLVAEGFPWQPGDNVVVPADEFPSNLYPWMNLASRGVACRQVKTVDGRLRLDDLAAACDARTRIVAVSWVSYSSGWRNDPAALAQLAHERGALLFLDAIQALGVFPLDVQASGVDFLAADGHKWLLGPEGAGLAYIRREHLDRLRPHCVGWHSVRHSTDYTHIELDLKPGAQRFEGGSENMPGFHALGASLDLLLEHGAEQIAQRLLEVTDRACERLEEFGASLYSDRSEHHSSGIVSFTLPKGDPKEVRKQCLLRGVVLSARAGRLRISPHAYNNDEDLDRLIEALAAG